MGLNNRDPSCQRSIEPDLITMTFLRNFDYSASKQAEERQMSLMKATNEHGIHLVQRRLEVVSRLNLRNIRVHKAMKEDLAFLRAVETFKRRL